MALLRFAARVARRLKRLLYHAVDAAFLPLDRSFVQRAGSVRLIPRGPNRFGGKYAYGDWAHTIGVFHALLFDLVKDRADPHLLDVGCGKGLVGLAAAPVLGSTGRYTGLDVVADNIAFCRRHFSDSRFDFIHVAQANAAYAAAQPDTLAPWPLADSQIDIVTALSVWTHLSERHALFYMREVSRVLKPGGIALITVFLLDETYRRRLAQGLPKISPTHPTDPADWVFDRPAYGSDHWFHTGWARVPEDAIGVCEAGLRKMLDAAGLTLAAHYPGLWKDRPGLYFQDAVLLHRPQ
ncbi:MAG: methyltransferase domain-containing protein [Rhodothalassiaceae bacterium]